MIVLASQSPRRSEILRQAGIPFVARPANVDETAMSPYVDLPAETNALRLEWEGE